MYWKANGFRPHWELLEMIGAVEFEAGVEAVSSLLYDVHLALLILISYCKYIYIYITKASFS